jgi:nucleoside-diphosphate-sugar epimerase
VLVTGGAGYIGSLLTGELLRAGYWVTVVDDLLFGGESLLAYLPNPCFHFVKANVWEPRAVRNAIRDDWPKPGAIVHLAAIAGFPACQAVGRQVAWRYNVEATQQVYEQAVDGCRAFLYADLQQLWLAGRTAVTEEMPPKIIVR